MNRVLVLLLVLVFNLFGYVQEESSVFGDPITQEEAQVDTVKVDTKNLYLSYESYPEHIYKNQRFEIVVKALITRDDFDSIQTNFVNDVHMVPLNAENEWEQSEDNSNTFTNKYYFKAYESDFKLPDIEVHLYNGQNLVETRTIPSKDVSFSEIAKSDNRFSNVIAQSLELIGSKSKQYTNKEALTILDIKAVESNLEDFNIKGIEDQGFTVIEDEYPEQHIIYYLVIPIHTKNIAFKYYNTTTNNLETINIPVVFEEELVSTQTDLNPNKSDFEFYKKVAVGILAGLFLILFAWKRKFYLLVLFLLTLIAFILFAMPNKTVKLKQNTVIYILPTKNSTIFRKVGSEIIVEDLKRKNGFVKIMFKSGTNEYIGWVKEEDVIKN